MLKKQIVEERLKLLSQLETAKENFRGVKFLGKNEEGEYTHSFKHFDALRNYLCLTCFDILGQTDEWLDFESWLMAKNKIEEKNDVFSKFNGENLNERIIEIHKAYVAIYGVKKSFYRFIDETISAENKIKLLESISADRQIIPPVEFADGSHRPGSGESIALSEAEKKKFLFDARNSFTHKGISYGSDTNGIFDFDNPFDLEGDLIWFPQVVIKKKKGIDLISYKVKRWPYLLMEIIDETITEIE